MSPSRFMDKDGAPMRKLLALALVGLTGCANFCDTLFPARGVCREQAAAAGLVSAPVVVSAPAMMSACSCAGGHVIATSEPYSTEVFSPGCDCACSGAVVMSPATGAVIADPQPVVMGSAVPVTTGAVQPVSEHKPHPFLRPFQWMREHHQSKQ
ncbi:hypothetical protein K2Y11_23425 [bacterium]|nr:hypothetical protein [bacterium]